MNKARLLLKYIRPYKWSAVRNVIYNILSAVFALVSYTLVIPFLKILFNRFEAVPPDPGEFRLTIDYLSSAGTYYLSAFIEKQGETGALMLVCLVVVVASLFKNEMTGTEWALTGKPRVTGGHKATGLEGVSRAAKGA